MMRFGIEDNDGAEDTFDLSEEDEDNEVEVTDEMLQEYDLGPLYIIVTGSRVKKQKYQVNARKHVRKIIAAYIQEAASIYDKIILVQGVCKDSPDVWCRQVAIEMGIEVLDYPAQWNAPGQWKTAGFMRNERMMAEVSAMQGMKECVAFWDGVSSGTDHAMQMADKYHITITKVVDMSAYRENE
jgi:hypothetical protein